MSNAIATGPFDPGLGRLPAAAAQTLFQGDGWDASAELPLVTALAAASPNTRNSTAVHLRWPYP